MQYELVFDQHKSFHIDSIHKQSNSKVTSSYNIKIIAYYFYNFDLINLIHVQIYANISWLQDTNLLERTIEINWSLYDEESVGFIYDMLNYDQNINMNPLTHQIQMMDDLKQFQFNPTSSESLFLIIDSKSNRNVLFRV